MALATNATRNNSVALDLCIDHSAIKDHINIKGGATVGVIGVHQDTQITNTVLITKIE